MKTLVYLASALAASAPAPTATSKEHAAFLAEAGSLPATSADPREDLVETSAAVSADLGVDVVVSDAPPPAGMVNLFVRPLEVAEGPEDKDYEYSLLALELGFYATLPAVSTHDAVDDTDDEATAGTPEPPPTGDPLQEGSEVA